MYVLWREWHGTVRGGFHFDPQLGSRGPNAAKNYLDRAPFGFRPLKLVAGGAGWGSPLNRRLKKPNKCLNPVSKITREGFLIARNGRFVHQKRISLNSEIGMEAEERST